MSKIHFLPKMAIFFRIPFQTLKDPKIQKKFYFQKVHVLGYKKHIYGFLISPIVTEISAIEEKNHDWESPLSGFFIFKVDFRRFEDRSHAKRCILCQKNIQAFQQYAHLQNHTFPHLDFDTQSCGNEIQQNSKNFEILKYFNKNLIKFQIKHANLNNQNFHNSTLNKYEEHFLK